MVEAQRGAVVDHRVHEQLEGDGRTTGVAGALGERRGQSPAGAAAADSDAAGVDAQLLGVVVQPAQGGGAVVEGCGEGVFGGEAVVDADDHDAEVAGQRGAELVVHLGFAEHEAATVDPQQGAGGFGEPVGPVDEHPGVLGALGGGGALVERHAVDDGDRSGGDGAHQAQGPLTGERQGQRQSGDP